jgi:hypothetical protein
MQNVGKSRSGNKAIQYQVGLKEGRSQLACLLVVAYCFRLGIAILLAAALVLVFCVRAGGVGVLSEDCSVGSATDAQNSVSLPSPDSRSMAQSCLKTHESLIHFVVLELALLQALFVPNEWGPEEQNRKVSTTVLVEARAPPLASTHQS